MKTIVVFNRETKKKEEEKIFGKKILFFLYGNSFFSKILLFFSKYSFFSFLYGKIQSLKSSKKAIKPFIKSYGVDESEFEKKADEFSSFNDFFIRKLKKRARPIVKDAKIAILPSDARYLVFQDLKDIDNFYIKGKKFNLDLFLKDPSLSKKYKDGSMMIARLNPTDYHRFFFPFDCFAKNPKLINGFLYSVNPIALQNNLKIFWENKRMVTSLKSKLFKDVLFIEIGATNVGSIHQTFFPNNEYKKADEKGYFSFGGSSIVMLFEKGIIKFDKDLIENTKLSMETKAKMGGVLGRSTI